MTETHLYFPVLVQACKTRPQNVIANCRSRGAVQVVLISATDSMRRSVDPERSSGMLSSGDVHAATRTVEATRPRRHRLPNMDSFPKLLKVSVSSSACTHSSEQ